MVVVTAAAVAADLRKKARDVLDIAPVAEAQFEALPVEPAAADDAPAQLIASSEQEWPIISVNEVSITPEAMAQELQYHPAESREEAVYLAAKALVIRELLQQRIAELGVSMEIGAGENEEEAATRLLLEREVHVPQCDEETSLRYYEKQSWALSQRTVAGGSAHPARVCAG